MLFLVIFLFANPGSIPSGFIFLPKLRTSVTFSRHQPGWEVLFNNALVGPPNKMHDGMCCQETQGEDNFLRCLQRNALKNLADHMILMYPSVRRAAYYFTLHCIGIIHGNKLKIFIPGSEFGIVHLNIHRSKLDQYFCRRSR